MRAAAIAVLCALAGMLACSAPDTSQKSWRVEKSRREPSRATGDHGDRNGDSKKARHPGHEHPHPHPHPHRISAHHHHPHPHPHLPGTDHHHPL